MKKILSFRTQVGWMTAIEQSGKIVELKFSKKKSEGKSIILQRLKKNVSDFIFVKDVIDIIYRSIVVSSKKPVCKQVNVLTGKTVSIDELAHLLMDEMNVNVRKNYQPLPVGDPEKSNGTTEKMIELLNVELKQMVSLEEGLARTVKFLKKDTL